MKCILFLIVVLPYFGLAQSTPLDTGELYQKGMWADVYMKKFKDERIETYSKKDYQILKIDYSKNPEKRIAQKLPITISYFASGNMQRECFQTTSGTVGCLTYADSTEKIILSGIRNSVVELSYKNNLLVEAHVDLFDPRPPPVDSPENPWKREKLLLGGFTEKGVFKDFELFNGFVYYYDEQGKLEKTDKISNGKNVYNPIIPVTDQRILDATHHKYDRNLNQRIETREAARYTVLVFNLTDSLVKTIDWKQLSAFKNLERIRVNKRDYYLKNYTNAPELRQAILSKSGTSGSSSGWVNPPSPFPTPVVEFPEVPAEFPGGAQELQLWLTKNTQYPQELIEKEIQGRVYVSFTVAVDGTIQNIKIERGVHPMIDSEAKRLVRSMPAWKPATVNNVNVISRVVVPILFLLPKKTDN